MAPQRFLKFSAQLAGCLALATIGCKSGSSLALNASTSATAADGGVQPDAGNGGGINLCGRLALDRVRLVVRRVDLERAPAAVDAGADAGQTVDGGPGASFCDCPDGGAVCVKPGGDVHLGPFLVDLQGSQLTGGIHQVFDVEVPEGTYEDVRFVINTLSRRQAAGDGGLAEMKDLHASIAASGSFGGSPFQFVTSMRLKQKQEGPFTVGPGTSNIILNVDPRNWFVGSNGQVLDPRDPTNRGRILANIRCSVRVSSGDMDDEGRRGHRDFEDDDEDRCRANDEDDDQGGHGSFDRRGDDDGGHHGGGDHPGDEGDGHACLPAPALDCGAPPADGGSPADGGVDGG